MSDDTSSLAKKLELAETSTNDVLFAALVLLIGLLSILPSYHIATLLTYILFVYTATKFYNNNK